MTGIDSWSTTPATNATADAGAVNWAEGQAPSTVNNSARQCLADVRALANDLAWFSYGTGDQGAGNIAVPAIYASGTSFTIAGADVTAAYHVGRRLRAVGVSTGTIYGSISATSYSPTTTTVTVGWDSGSLSNETLVISLSQIPLTGAPTPVISSTYLSRLSTEASYSFSRIQKTTGIAQSSTVDIFRFLDTSGTVSGNGFVIGHFYINVIDQATGNNQGSYALFAGSTGNGLTNSLTDSFLLTNGGASSKIERGTVLVASFILAADGAGGAVKLQIMTGATGKTVTTRVTFVGMIN